jgi:hypothetical protein
MLKTIYEVELQMLKDWDEVQFTTNYKGFDFIETAGHGYLVVPKNHPKYKTACKISEYGFKGSKAVYLEEDNEAKQFLQKISV